MCGRFTLTESDSQIAATFDLPSPPVITPRYNIAPTQQILTIIKDTHRQWKWMRWGLIPSWAKDLKIGSRLINARAETLSEKPSFRSAFKKRRCLIVADGFYEWHHQGKTKQPYYFQMQDNQSFAMAGLWETWNSENSETIISATIITTTANDIVEPIHNRMPVILPPDSYEQWLDSNITTPESLQPLLIPLSSEKMKATPVKTTLDGENTQ